MGFASVVRARVTTGSSSSIDSRRQPSQNVGSPNAMLTEYVSMSVSKPDSAFKKMAPAVRPQAEPGNHMHVDTDRCRGVNALPTQTQQSTDTPWKQPVLRGRTLATLTQHRDGVQAEH